MSDAFAALAAPAGSIQDATPDGSDVVLDPPARSLWVGGGGNVYVDAVNEGSNVLFTVPDGGIVPVRVTRVRNASTTATNIVALW